ncbi:hypothetical protein SDC9_182459 [bioreactor metagenome]|uniref:Uncharacterized protein n=1 Tax=bioreactor metagenome TaxID=1076179 RepID=A0A645H7I3_9ZZZZ
MDAGQFAPGLARAQTFDETIAQARIVHIDDPGPPATAKLFLAQAEQAAGCRVGGVDATIRPGEDDRLTGIVVDQPQTLLALPEPSLILLAHADIEMRTDGAQRTPRGIPFEDLAVVQDPDPVAVAMADAMFRFVGRRPAAEMRDPGGLGPRPVFRVQAAAPAIDVGRQSFRRLAQH